MDPAPQVEKKKNGCINIVVILVLVVGGLYVFEYAINRIFHSAFPADELTKTFIPYQNNYLAFTDAYLTSEGMTGEFSEDMSASGRFLSYCIPLIPVLFIVTVILYIIPFTKKLVSYAWYGIYLPSLVLVLLYTFLFPSNLTTFDRGNKKMIVTKHHWIFLKESVEVPFEMITGFVHEKEEVHSYDHDQLEFVTIYALVGERKIYLGENYTGRHPQGTTNWEITPAKLKETAELIDALKKLTGVK